MKHHLQTFDMQEIVEILSIYRIFIIFKYVWLKQLKNNLQEKQIKSMGGNENTNIHVW